jgi:S1-C subfamily serine protease
MLALLICVVALTVGEGAAQFYPAENSILHVGILVVQPSHLPPGLEKYRGIAFLPIAFGTSFVVSREGHVVTTLHVIKRAEKLGSEILVGGKKLVVCANRPAGLYECDEARIIALDEDHELALLKMKSIRCAASLSAVRLSPTKPMEGTQIWAAGYPGNKGGQLTITVGTFLSAGQSDSALAPSRSPTPGERFWFADMVVEKGASGGPIYLQDGSVIGVLVNRSTTHAIAGFVPAQHVIALMARSGVGHGTIVE